MNGLKQERRMFRSLAQVLLVGLLQIVVSINALGQDVEPQPEFEPNVELVAPVAPRAGSQSSSSTSSCITLDALVQRAIQIHPSLSAAMSRVEAANAQALQSGLCPNPSVGVFGNEVGVEGQGQYGIYISQNHVRNNQLQLSRLAGQQQAVVFE